MKKAVLVTTDKRGVFFGYANQEDLGKDTLRLEHIQMCVYWSADVQGVLGLAATGPSYKCRVTKEVPVGTINSITMICECSKEAEKAWKKQPWNS